MAQTDTKQSIKTSIQTIQNGNLTANALSFFKTLGYNTQRQQPFKQKTYAYFKELYLDGSSRFNEEKALVSQWKYIDLLFQLSKEEVSRQHGLFNTKQVDRTIIETYLFFAVELTKAEYTRTAMAQITREINKVFPMPVMVLFKYGNTLTLSVINRRLHKRDEQKDVLEKVTLIKDISTERPHRAHIEILFDLSFDELLRVHQFSNFVELHNAWQKTLDTKELNKRFYQELSNWYFWAMDHVSFPDDIEKKESTRNATSLIRLITRIIFIWFIKEKNLVPNALFDRRELARILKEFFKNKESHSYYQAILQNLFFGTLNQKMNDRGFAKEDTFQGKNPSYGVKTLFRYADQFSISLKDAVALFENIPFLNGGLFDCLDKENDEGKVLYADGFSRNPKKQAMVPDFLFFSAEKEYDLNDIYGTKNKKYTVNGLFEILSGYKFTIAENTPIEEEVALDPELLGRVFENLLASYNPETQTTARKQTGSFYTPREIVNYMVDESLKAHFKQKLETEAKMKPEDAEIGLDLLIGYNEKEHLFDQKQTAVLIKAIDNSKIIDPACGSGAFPMGVLHKLVHILHKLDPKNELWEKRQIEKVELLINEAQKITDNSFREKVIADLEANRKDIESAFENNELDYGRKLYLIENCIYGVDIQAIAIQISKLRFFISLIVDQKVNPAKENLGIRSLPNLETKFAAANTLIGLEKPKQMLLKNPKIDQLENELKELRHRYFSAKTRKEKMAFQKDDKILRQKISKLLIDDGWESGSAKLIVSFDPYDQNASSPFFDPEWMFGIKDGFDVVIGNPPYIFTRDAEFSDEFKGYIAERYFSLLASKDKDKKTKANQSGKINLFALFILRGLFDLRKNGHVALIVPNNLLRTTTYDMVRKYLIDNTIIEEIVDLGSGVFDNVTASTITFRIANTKPQDNVAKIITDIEDIEKKLFTISRIEQNQFKQNVSYTFNLFADIAVNQILTNISQGKTHLGQHCVDIIEGIVAHKHLIEESNGKGKFPLVEGKTIKRYYLEDIKKYIIWDTHQIHRTRPDYLWESDKKIIIQRISGGSMPLTATIDTKKLRTFASVNNLLLKNEFEDQYEYILALINSKVLNWYYANSFSNNSELTVNISKTFLEKLPIVKYNDEKHGAITAIVGFTLLAKSLTDQTKVYFLEDVIDAMVYELYFPDEIKAADAEVLKHLTNLQELKDDWSDEKKLATIEKVQKELSNPKHPVSIAMEKMKTVSEVRIIEGLDKS